MRDTELYAQILGIKRPWTVTGIDLDREAGTITVSVEHISENSAVCPKCQEATTRHDTRRRKWRHLDTCQYVTILDAGVPRASCSAHGVQTMKVPWAEPKSRFTAMFEALVIDWLVEASINGVARQLGLSWDEVSGIMERAVERGLARRDAELPTTIAVDETSFQKRHEYVTIVHDPRAEKKRVLYVADGHGKDALEGFLSAFSDDERAAVSTVVMDMHAPFIAAVRAQLPDGESKIAFDKFHVAKHLSDAVNKVRREEHKTLMANGDERLKGTRFLWLKNPERSMSDEQWKSFESLRKSSLKTARAWALKEAAMEVWEYTAPQNQRRLWRDWYNWAIRSRLEPIKKTARMIKRHLNGILLAARENITNASAEGLNTSIQKLKAIAHGYRNRARFRNAIYFHHGGLDLYPALIER